MRGLVGKPEGRRPLGRPRHRCEDNIKMDFTEVGWGTWTGSFSGYGHVEGFCECGNKLSISLKCGVFLE
jgi:hypothetical protein